MLKFKVSAEPFETFELDLVIVKDYIKVLTTTQSRKQLVDRKTFSCLMC